MKELKLAMIILLSVFFMVNEIPLTAAIEEHPDTGEYEEWQSESDGYKEEKVDICLSVSGIDSVEIRIADSQDWEAFSDGAKIQAIRANSIEIKGIEGYWLSAAYGETKAEAMESPAVTVSEAEGGNTSVGVDNDGYIHIKVAVSKEEAEGGSAASSENADGDVTWSVVSNTQADSGNAKSTSVYKIGQTFYGKATAISRVPRDGGSTITFRHDTGWIRNETKVKNITAVCISGHSRGLAYVGAEFNYVATIKDVSGKELKIEVVYYPRKNKPNTWYGSMAPKAQIMARTLWVSQYEHTGYVQLKKVPVKSENDYLKECPNNYSLANAMYYLYTDSSCSSRAKDTDGKEIVLTTDAFGATNTAEVELGGDSKVFWAKEITASQGFKKDPSVRSVTVTTANTSDKPAVIQSSEPPSLGLADIKVYKLDPTGRYGWNKLRNAEYRIDYYDVTDRNRISSSEPKRSWIFRSRKLEGKTPGEGYYAGFDCNTDETVDGSHELFIESDIRIIPCGWFTIREIKAPSGLSLDTGISFGHVYQPSNGATAIVDIEKSSASEGGGLEVVSEDSPQRVKIVIDKKDASTKKNEARESINNHSNERRGRYASLKGAEYEVYYDDDDLKTPELVGMIITDEKGHGELDKRTMGDERFIGDRLALGSYIIKEVKASAGYAVDRYFVSEGIQKTRNEADTKILCAYEAEGTAVKKMIAGKYEKGTHLVRARAEHTDTQEFIYTVSSEEEPLRTYISKTDITTGEELPGAKLQIISLNEEDKGTIVEEWISGKEEHLVWALPCGKYRLREITAPYGYDTAEDIEFEIKDNTIINHVRMENKPVDIATNSVSVAYGNHHGIPMEAEVVKDTVKISGLYAGRIYKVTGKLVDKATGNTIKDHDGNDTYAETIFTAEGDRFETNLEFILDSSAFTHENYAVGFENLYRISESEKDGPENGQDTKETEIAKHEDLEAASQTICYGGIIRTRAFDSKAKSRNIISKRTSVIKDFVDFKGLSTTEEYTLDAELYDKTEGRMTGIKASLNFRPEESDGTAEVVFRFDSRGMEDHSLVVFETLRLNGRYISEHRDPEDSEQTVFIKPRISPETGERGILLAWITLTTAAGMFLLIMILRAYSERRRTDI